MGQIPNEILIAVATTLTVSLLTLLFSSVRNALFYKRVEYDFIYTKPNDKNLSNECQWDIQWEDYRLTVAVGDVSNDKLEVVTFIRNQGKQVKFDILITSESFEPLFNKEIYFKINSIIRVRPPEGQRSYILRFVFRRRRW
jgi:hypothetical protein